ncbi:MAG: hypothetical protein OEV00_10230 [Acidobacteriota bacterium]|nr:hypothetical protein [Acidobacteriota bacterium]
MEIARHGVRCGLIMMAGLLTTTLMADPLKYDLEIPSHDSISYELELDIQHPGPIHIEANWDCRRIVTFRLQSPQAGRPAMRRSSPSPFGFTTNIVEPGDAPWRLSIYVMPGSEPGVGELTIQLPGPPLIPTPAEPSAKDFAPRPAGEPWKTRVADLPETTPVAVAQLVDSVERFRRLVVGPDAAPDSCRWQLDGLRFLAQARDQALRNDAKFDFGSRELFRTIAKDIAGVDAMRRSDDPLVSGPPPADPGLSHAWNRMHRDRVQPLEAQLDRTYDLATGDYAAELTDQTWLPRLVSCVVASQRYFSDRARVGPVKAINREIALDQWDRLLAVSDALEDLSRATTPPEGQTIQLSKPR